MSIPKSEVLQVVLSKHHSLDIVRMPHDRKYRIVFAERFGVQKRQFVDISFEEALRVSLFLASVDDRMRTFDLGDDRTLGGKPSNVPPAEIKEMLDDEAHRTGPYARDRDADQRYVQDIDPIPRVIPEAPITVPARTPEFRTRLAAERAKPDPER